MIIFFKSSHKSFIVSIQILNTLFNLIFPFKIIYDFYYTRHPIKKIYRLVVDILYMRDYLFML